MILGKNIKGVHYAKISSFTRLDSYKTVKSTALTHWWCHKLPQQWWSHGCSWELGYGNAPVQQCPKAGAGPADWNGGEKRQTERKRKKRGKTEKEDGEQERHKGIASQAVVRDENGLSWMNREAKGSCTLLNDGVLGKRQKFANKGWTPLHSLSFHLCNVSVHWS